MILGAQKISNQEGTKKSRGQNLFLKFSGQNQSSFPKFVAGKIHHLKSSPPQEIAALKLEFADLILKNIFYKRRPTTSDRKWREEARQQLNVVQEEVQVHEQEKFFVEQVQEEVGMEQEEQFYEEQFHEEEEHEGGKDQVLKDSEAEEESDEDYEEVDEEDEDDDDEETDEEVEEEEGENEEEIVYGGLVVLDLVKDYDTHITSKILNNEEREPLTCINHFSKLMDWEIPEHATTFRQMIDMSGLSSLLHTCYKSVNRNSISAFVERWYPETNTFHLPFGEMIITLDDVSSLLHILIVGKPVETLYVMRAEAVRLVVKYLGYTVEEAREEMNEKVGMKLSLASLYDLFVDVNDRMSVRRIRRAARAYLVK